VRAASSWLKALALAALCEIVTSPVEMGLGGDIEHPKVAEAVAVVADAARRHGKWSGIGGIGSEELLRHYIGIGMRVILGGNDFSFMMAAARQRAHALRRT